jgi:hypothetical protein
MRKLRSFSAISTKARSALRMSLSDLLSAITDPRSGHLDVRDMQFTHCVASRHYLGCSSVCVVSPWPQQAAALVGARFGPTHGSHDNRRLAEAVSDHRRRCPTATGSASAPSNKYQREAIAVARVEAFYLFAADHLVGEQRCTISCFTAYLVKAVIPSQAVRSSKRDELELTFLDQNYF